MIYRPSCHVELGDDKNNTTTAGTDFAVADNIIAGIALISAIAIAIVVVVAAAASTNRAFLLLFMPLFFMVLLLPLLLLLLVLLLPVPAPLPCTTGNSVASIAVSFLEVIRIFRIILGCGGSGALQLSIMLQTPKPPGVFA